MMLYTHRKTEYITDLLQCKAVLNIAFKKICLWIGRPGERRFREKKKETMKLGIILSIST